MLLERIAEEEQIDVSDEEIEAEIEAIAQASRQSKEQVRGVLTKEGGERSIANRLRNRKALDLLRENAHVTEEEWREEQPGVRSRHSGKTRISSRIELPLTHSPFLNFDLGPELISYHD